MVDLAFNAFAFPAEGAPANRTLPDRLKDRINVKDYGAVGDGIADDINAIHAALDHNSILLTLPNRAYSGAHRVTSASWAGGTLTVNFLEPHGWTGTVGIRLAAFSASPGTIDGAYTATVIDADTVTVPYPVSPGTIGYVGHARPQITGATWASNIVTLTFAAAHRLVTGVAVKTAGFAPTGLNGNFTVTRIDDTTLTYPLTGSGAVTVTSGCTCIPRPILTFASVPSTISNSNNQYLVHRRPDTPASHFGHAVTSVTATTITLASENVPLQADIPAGSQVRIARAHRGTIFFPPGTYRINSPIYYEDSAITSRWLGVPGKSIIRAGAAGVGFDGYLFIQNLKVAQGGPTIINKMTFINEHATGKGLQICTINIGIKDCVFEANQCLNYSADDYLNAVCFSVTLNACYFRPGVHTSGSVAVMLSTNNASVTGNYVEGFSEGFRGANFGKAIFGNIFKDNGIGINSGMNHLGQNYANSYSVTAGNAFFNNGTGVFVGSSSGSARYEGNYIEGGAGATYGLRKATISQINLIRGLDIAGDFTTLAINIEGGDAANRWNQVRATRAINDAGVSWGSMPAKQHTCSFVECNDARIHTYTQLNGRALNSATWSGGNVTLTTHEAHGLLGGFTVHVSGVEVGGSTANNYNGVFAATAPLSNTIQYALPVNPGGATANTGIAHGASSATSSRPIKTGLSWSAGEVTAETWGDHRIGPGSSLTIGGVTVGGSLTNGYNVANFNSSQFTVTGPTTFKYAVASDPGTPDASSLSATAAAGRTFSKANTSATNALGSNFSTAQGITRNISNGAKLGGGTALIGDLVQGSGVQHIKVVWTDKGWARCG